jgi:hypothetical protein
VSKKKMELTVGQYGDHLFEMMVGRGVSNPGYCPDHWESIRAEAEPLVRRLIALNDEMKGGGYSIVGYHGADAGGRKKLPLVERILLAQKKLWLVKAGDLREGDLVWLYKDYDIEMYIEENDPVAVTEITKKGVYLDHPFERHGTYRISPDAEVFRAPDDWEEKQHVYQTQDYWVEQADRLGI